MEVTSDIENCHKNNLSKMIREINKVLTQHLSNILTPVLEETNNINKILLNVPMIAKMKKEFVDTKHKLIESLALNKELNTEICQLKKQLNKLQDKLQNITLEVKELPKLNPKPQDEIINNTFINQNKKLETDSSPKLASYSNLNYFTNMISDDDEYPDTDSEKDESNSTIKIIKNLESNTSSIVEIEDVKENIKDEEEVVDKDEEEVVDEDEEEVVDKDEEVVDEDEEVVDEDEEEVDEEDEEKVDEEDEEEEDEEVDDEDEEEVDDEDEEVDEEDEEVDEEDEEEVDDEDEEDDMEVEDVTINGVVYLTTSLKNGTIYKIDEDGEILEDKNGDWIEAGYYKNGKPTIF